MPISAVIHLIPPEDVTLRPTMGHHAHAAFLSLLRLSNPEKAEEIHTASTQKPFTVSPLIGNGTRRGSLLRIRAGTECRLRFTFLNDALFAHFGSAFLTQGLPSIRLGGAVFQLSRWVISGEETKDWSRNATYEKLIESARTDTRMRLRFYSPTTFRELSPHGKKTRNQPHIHLVRCYQSWVNKWNTFAPMQIDKQPLLDFIESCSLATRLEMKTQMLDFGRHKAIGFVGSCDYEFCEDWTDTKPELSDPKMVRFANLLADFAFYCGTGYKTTMGMGQTRRQGFRSQD